MFAARLDMEVAGQDNLVSEVDLVTEPPSDSNPDGNGFQVGLGGEGDLYSSPTDLGRFDPLSPSRPC